MNSPQKSEKWDRVNHHNSKSLWNYTLSPGWNEEEVNVLKNALQIFGVGRWRAIINSNCLPGKTIGQIYMQTQRLIGQQSLGDYMGLQVDLQAIYLQNMAKTGQVRKNNSIINMGDNPNKEERKKRIKENQIKYGLSEKYIKTLSIPSYKSKLLYQYLSLEDLQSKKFTTLDVIKNLDFVRNLLIKKINRIEEQDEEHNPNKKIVINLTNLGEQTQQQQLKQQKKTQQKIAAKQMEKLNSYKIDNVEYSENGEVTFSIPEILNIKKINQTKMKIMSKSDKSFQ